MSEAIIVLGMHRAGTSLITHFLREMGAYLGPDNALIPANNANPKGYFERRDTMRTNNDILALQKANWSRPKNWRSHPLPDATTDIHTRLYGITTELKVKRPLLMKDPRFCLTLPYWLPYLGETTLVMSYRDPLEIARSLEIRSKMPLDYGLALWEFYTVHALRIARDRPHVFVSHAALLQDPVAAIYAARQQLTALGVAELKTLAPEAILAVADAKLYRSKPQNLFLSEHQLRIAAMQRGEIPIDPDIFVSKEAQARLRV